MNRLRRWFSQRRLNAFLGLMTVVLLGIAFMISCGKDESSKVTAPNIPAHPAYEQPSENSNQMGFWSAKGDGWFGAWTGDIDEFLISVPAGEFALTYATTIGTFYVAFRATDAAILHIGLGANVRVSEASVQRGKITNASLNRWESNSVTLFAWPGSGAAWNAVFQGDGTAALMLIIGGQAAPDVNKLPAPTSASTSPTTSTTTLPTTTSTTTSASSTSTSSTSSTSTTSASSTSTTSASSTSTTSTTSTTIMTDPCAVANENDSGDGSLRQILTNAACSTITFASGVFNIMLNGTQLTVARDVTINSDIGVVINGNGLSRVFYVESGVTATFIGLTITNGKVISDNDGGGGILNKGTLTLESSTTVSSNTVEESGSGGGIANFGTLTVTGTVSDNAMIYGDCGGGIYNSSSGTLTLDGIVSVNTSSGSGGGICNEGELTLGSRHEISGNHADNKDTNGAGKVGGGLSTVLACPANANYGNGNYRGSATTVVDNCGNITGTM